MKNVSKSSSSYHVCSIWWRFSAEFDAKQRVCGWYCTDLLILKVPQVPYCTIWAIWATHGDKYYEDRYSAVLKSEYTAEEMQWRATWHQEPWKRIWPTGTKHANCSVVTCKYQLQVCCVQLTTIAITTKWAKCPFKCYVTCVSFCCHSYGEWSFVWDALKKKAMCLFKISVLNDQQNLQWMIFIKTAFYRTNDSL